MKGRVSYWVIIYYHILDKEILRLLPQFRTSFHIKGNSNLRGGLLCKSEKHVIIFLVGYATAYFTNDTCSSSREDRHHGYHNKHTRLRIARCPSSDLWEEGGYFVKPYRGSGRHDHGQRAKRTFYWSFACGGEEIMAMGLELIESSSCIMTNYCRTCRGFSKIKGIKSALRV